MNIMNKQNMGHIMGAPDDQKYITSSKKNNRLAMLLSKVYLLRRLSKL